MYAPVSNKWVRRIKFDYRFDVCPGPYQSHHERMMYGLLLQGAFQVVAVAHKLDLMICF